MNKLKLLAVAFLLLVTPLAFAKGYIELDQPAARHAPGNNIEVTAVFSYTCGYCFQLEPRLATWQKTLPEDVKVYRLHAAFNKQWEHFARAHYVMDALQLTEEAHWPFFLAIHEQNANLASQQAVNRFFANYQVESSKVEGLYTSFGVNNRVAQDITRLRAYKITGVPALVINGKYVINGETAGGLPQMLEVASKLITQLRENK